MINKAVAVLTVSLSVFLFGVLLAVYNQVKFEYNSLVSGFEMAVFVKKDTKVSLDVIKEQIINSDSITNAEYIDPDTALKTAMDLIPNLNEMIVMPQNPFSSYFKITIDKVSAVNVNSVKERINKFEGVDEIRFDPNVVEIVDKLRVYRNTLKAAAKTLLSGACLVFVIRVILLFAGGGVFKLKTVLSYIFTALFASITGVALYLILRSSLNYPGCLEMPDKYFLISALFGLFCAFGFNYTENNYDDEEIF